MHLPTHITTTEEYYEITMSVTSYDMKKTQFLERQFESMCRAATYI
jgi:hypothetical protein